MTVSPYRAGEFMNRLLIVAILIIGIFPLYAQSQQPNAAKLKADAQKVVSITSGDKVQTYCQINNLVDQIGEAEEDQDTEKVGELAQKFASP
jgi:preprotein translocase subunit YajC